jgi:putative hydrolase of the HAD superfamily
MNALSGSGVRAVFFDAVGTLIEPDPPAAVVYFEVGRRFGSRMAVQEIRQRFAAAFAEEEESDRRLGLHTNEERELHRWRGIVSRVLDDVVDSERCFAELRHYFSLPTAWRLEAEALEVLESLAGRGYILGLASNYDRRLRSVVAGFPGLNRVERVVVSSEVGWRKPAPEFYAALCRSAGLPPEQILYVGDDPASDYNGARALGIRAVLFDPKEKRPAGVTRITRLGDLLDGAG